LDRGKDQWCSKKHSSNSFSSTTAGSRPCYGAYSAYWVVAVRT